jgi:GT2 family glycosyltransferase
VPDVAVIVGNYEGEAVLGDCLASLEAQTLRPTEVIVVDADSSDGSAAVAATYRAAFLRRENRGLGHLYNEGARASEAPYLMLLNNDVALDARCLERLHAELSRNERRFAADPRQLDWAGGRIVHARAVLTGGPLLRQPLPGFRLDLCVHSDTVVPTVSANGGAMLVRRDRMLALGGFDETMFMDFEDIDLCWRAWLRGWESVYVPDAVVRHRVGAVTSPGRIMSRRLRSSHHNLLRFALKCFPARHAALVVAGELLRLPRHPRLIVPALARIVAESREIMRARRLAAPTTEHMRWCLAGMP